MIEFWFLTIILNAQISISGKIIDDKQKSLKSNTILLLKKADSSLVKSAITNDNRTFTLEVTNSQLFILSINGIEYQKYFQDKENINAWYINFKQQLNKKWELITGMKAEQTIAKSISINSEVINIKLLIYHFVNVLKQEIFVCLSLIRSEIKNCKQVEQEVQDPMQN